MGIVFIELKKAFDTVDHKILWNKLAIYGVHRHELSWLESILQIVKNSAGLMV